MKIKTWYICEICEGEYETEDRARACEAQGWEPTLKVGDVVTCGFGARWFDGDPKWLVNPQVGTGKPGSVSIYRQPCPKGGSNCFDGCCTYGFYYVITGISKAGSPGDHVPVYELETGAMSEDSGHRFKRERAMSFGVVLVAPPGISPEALGVEGG